MSDFTVRTNTNTAAIRSASAKKQINAHSPMTSTTSHTRASHPLIQLSDHSLLLHPCFTTPKEGPFAAAKACIQVTNAGAAKDSRMFIHSPQLDGVSSLALSSWDRPRGNCPSSPASPYCSYTRVQPHFPARFIQSDSLLGPTDLSQSNFLPSPACSAGLYMAGRGLCTL